ncbi:GNAT family N-acetyltransferase [Actinoplanes flavus]|uniref:GNAT family N-acetyltransferase n=1 Tax=Actinoplanes flavus TaxID=2820290 RepID=A0ABS3USW2_9ACTN|nr:GNAT family N-acetyltransferase [Actinoplanes flavus]MBO3741677.1 GNAT family N-acetyltransferase [Actinoplanes flavus]
MEGEQIERVRDFNRYYTQRFSALADRFLGRDWPIGLARLLFAVGVRCDLRDLCARLGQNRDQVRRQLAALAVQGLVVLGDRTAELTDAGLRQRDELNQRAEAGIAALLGELTGRQRRRLLAAQDEIRRVLRAAAVVVAAVPPDLPAARDCLSRYAAELDATFPEGFDAGVLTCPDEVTGTQLLATEQGRPVGCGLWLRLGPGVAEIRHLWVAPEARGLGIGRKLLGRLEVDAANRGIATVRLGTHPLLTEALALYRSAGYDDIGGYSDNAYNQLAFEKVLVRADVAGSGPGRADGTCRPPSASASRRGAVASGFRR